LGVLVPGTYLFGKQTEQRAGDLQVEIDLQADYGRQRIKVKALHRLSEPATPSRHR
jgi:hypothetical protein